MSDFLLIIYNPYTPSAVSPVKTPYFKRPDFVDCFTVFSIGKIYSTSAIFNFLSKSINFNLEFLGKMNSGTGKQAPFVPFGRCILNIKEFSLLAKYLNSP